MKLVNVVNVVIVVMFVIFVLNFDEKPVPLFHSRPSADVLHERQGPDGDVGDPGAGADPLERVRPRRARVPEGAGRDEEVSEVH